MCHRPTFQPKPPLPGPLGMFNLVLGFLWFATLWSIPFLFAAAAVKWSWCYLFGGES